MKKFSLSIKEPCHQNWHQMTPNEQSRYCASCRKSVVDFTGMSDRQLVQFFQQSNGNVCGRFYEDQLQRPIDPPKKQVPFLKYFFTIVLPAFFVSLKSQAQPSPTSIEQRPPVRRELLGDTILPAPVKSDRFRMMGKVWIAKPHQACKPNSVDSVMPAVGKIQAVIQRQRKVNIHSVSPQTMPLSVQKILPIRTSEFKTVELEQPLVGILGVVAITPIKVKTEKPAKSISIRQTQTSNAGFTLAPNPALSGSMISIQPTDFATGRYAVELLTSGGQVLQSHEVMMSKGAAVQIPLQQLKAASYLIRLTNKATGKSSSQMFVVQ